MFFLNIHLFRKVARAIRTIQGRKSVEPYLAEALVERNHILEDYFDSHIYVLNSNSENEIVQKVGVVCNNVEGLVTELIQRRELDVNTSDVHIGIDGGQGSIKVGLTITDRATSESCGLAAYS